MSNLHPNLELRHGVRLDPQRNGSWDNADGTSAYITETIVSVWARRGIDPGGDRAFAVDPAGEMRVTLDDPDGHWSRWGSNARATLEGTPIRLELLVVRDSLGVFFSSYVLWGGWIESIDYQPSQSGSHRTVLQCLGPVAQAARTQLDLEAQYGMTFQQVVQYIEGEWGRMRLLAPGIPGSTFRIWWQDTGDSVMDSLSAATIADGGRLFEGRSLQIRLYSGAQLDVANRFVGAQVMLTDALYPKHATRKQQLDNARATARQSAYSSPPGHNAVAVVSAVEVRPPENVILNKVLYNVNAIEIEASGSIWTDATATYSLSRSQTVITVGAVMPQGQLAVEWVTPVEGTHFTSAGGDGAVGVTTLKTATRMDVTFAISNQDAALNRTVTISGLDFHGRRVTLDTDHIDVSARDTGSVTLFGERVLQWRNQLLSDEPSSATASDHTSGQDQAREMISRVLYRYSQLQLRTFVDVDANLAGRWAVEELSVPHARITLDAERLHLGPPEDHWIRGWQYQLTTGNRARMRLILEPVVTREQTDLVFDASLVQSDDAVFTR